MHYIVIDPNHEVVLGLGLLEFVEDGLDHGGGKFLRRQAIATADDLDIFAVTLKQGIDHIQVERIATRSGFLGAVHYRDRLYGLGQGLEEIFS